MINSIRLLFLVLIFVGFSSIVTAQSETLDIKRLSKDADVILTGKVSQKESSWNDSKTRIYTKVRVYGRRDGNVPIIASSQEDTTNTKGITKDLKIR